MKKTIVLICIALSCVLAACGSAPASDVTANTSSLPAGDASSVPDTDLRTAQSDGGEWLEITASVREVGDNYFILARVDFLPLENSLYVADNATLVCFKYNTVKNCLPHAGEVEIGPFPISLDISFQLVSVQNSTLDLSWDCDDAVEFIHWNNPVFNCHQK